MTPPLTATAAGSAARFRSVAAACRLKAAELRAEADRAAAPRDAYLLRRRAGRLMADAAACDALARQVGVDA
jgi:hypothetical protein